MPGRFDDVTHLPRESVSSGSDAADAGEARLRALVENVCEGIVVCEELEDGRGFVVLDINKAALEAEHLTAEEALGRSVVEVVPDMHDSGLLAAFHKVSASGQPERLIVRRYSGRRLLAWRDHTVIRLPAGEIATIWHEDRPHASTESDQRAQSRFLGALLSSIPSPVFYKDTEGLYLGCNKAFEELVGLAAEDIIGHTVHELWPEKYAATYRDKDLDLFETPGTQHYEFNLADASGQQRDVVFYKSTFDGPDGRVAGLVGVILDITERKKRERMELELREAQKLQAVGQLASGIAHEINNPLSVISGFAQGIEKRIQEDDPLHMPIESILREAHRCRNLVRDLLTFSRTTRLTAESVDLNELVWSAATILETRSRTQNVRVALELADDVPAVHANRTQLGQVLLNTGTNGLDAMTAGGVLTLRTARRDTGVVLEVIDTGLGIPEEIRDRIFEPFFTTRGVGKGTGLGLSLVREIVEQHQGRIEVQSEVGKGTTVSIEWPVAGTSDEHEW